MYLGVELVLEMCFGGCDSSGMTHSTARPTPAVSDVPAKEGGDQSRQASLGHLGLMPPQVLSTHPPGFLKTPDGSSPEHTLHAYMNAQCAWRLPAIGGPGSRPSCGHGIA